ncbi:MAG: YraN family protein [Rhodosalinus sp.]
MTTTAMTTMAMTEAAGFPPFAAPGRARRVRRGRVAALSGVAAEAGVERHYRASGRPVVARRWRGAAGEIDLVVREGARVVFVEVKAARSFEAAATRLGRRQMDRLCAAAEEFVGQEPGGLLTEMRFDLALVDGSGAVKVIENAFGSDW